MPDDLQLAVGHLEDVTFTYPAQDAPALRGVTLRLAVGETVALVGEKGAGKTTILLTLTGELAPAAGRLWPSPAVRVAIVRQVREGGEAGPPAAERPPRSRSAPPPTSPPQTAEQPSPPRRLPRLPSPAPSAGPWA